jgi:hypothetical protein
MRRRKDGKVAAHEPTPETMEQAALMSGLGLTHEQIALIMGISADTLTRHYKESLDRGLARATMQVTSTLFTKARAGEPWAVIFWLKARAKWSERSVVEHQGEVRAKLSGRLEHEHRAAAAAADAAVVDAVREIERALGSLARDQGGGGGAAGVAPGAPA